MAGRRWLKWLTTPPTESIQTRMKWWRERAHSSFWHKKNQTSTWLRGGGFTEEGISRGGATAHQEKHPFKSDRKHDFRHQGFPANMFVVETAAEATQTRIPAGVWPLCVAKLSLPPYGLQTVGGEKNKNKRERVTLTSWWPAAGQGVMGEKSEKGGKQWHTGGTYPGVKQQPRGGRSLSGKMSRGDRRGKYYLLFHKPGLLLSCYSSQNTINLCTLISKIQVKA